MGASSEIAASVATMDSRAGMNQSLSADENDNKNEYAADRIVAQCPPKVKFAAACNSWPLEDFVDDAALDERQAFVAAEVRDR